MKSIQIYLLHEQAKTKPIEICKDTAEWFSSCSLYTQSLHNTKSDLHKMLIYITRFSRSQLYLELTLIPMHTERWCICVLCMSAYFSKSSLSLTSVHPDTWTLHVAAHKIRTEWPVDGWDEGGWHAPSTRSPRSAPATLWRFKVPWLLQYVSSIYTGQPVVFEYHSQHTSASFISS